jgi:hypothetical protein
MIPSLSHNPVHNRFGNGRLFQTHLGDSFVPVEDRFIASSPVEPGTDPLPLNGLCEGRLTAAAFRIRARSLIFRAISSTVRWATIPTRAARLGKSEIAVRELMVKNERHKSTIHKAAVRARIGAIRREYIGLGGTALSADLFFDGDAEDVVESHVIG